MGNHDSTIAGVRARRGHAMIFTRFLAIVFLSAHVATSIPIHVIDTAVAGSSSPQEIHLTFGHDHTSMSVSWADVGKPPSNQTGHLSSHVTFGTDPSAMDRTASATPSVLVSAGEGPPYTPSGFCTGPDQVHTFHSVTLTNLEPDTEYYYYAFVLVDGVATNDRHRSATFRFRSAAAPKSPAAASLHFFAVADMGDPVSHNWVAIPEMARLSANRSCPESEAGYKANTLLDSIWDLPVSLGLHVGDIAYDLNLGPRGDDYMRGVSPMAATYPWMFTAGNHEADCNYTYANYNARYAAQNKTASSQAPASGSSRYYSFDLGPVHFIAIDTDGYAFGEVAYVLPPMYEWLEADLEAVDRSITPWIVLMGHRPMYCTSLTSSFTSHLGWPLQPDELIQPGKPIPPEPANYGDAFRARGLVPPPWLFHDPQLQDWPSNHSERSPAVYDCGVAELIRNGMVSAKDGSRHFAIEPLMEKYGVDLYLTGHEHNYERTLPVLNGTASQASDPNTFHSPGKPIHILTGAGGAYSHDQFGPWATYDAFRTLKWSFSDLAANATHLGFKQRLASNGQVIDEFVLSREP